MNLFLDTISPQNALILFDDDRKIISEYFFDVRLNESTRLIEEFDAFLQKNNLVYADLENIVVVNGPGSFTGVRTTVLLVNTINFVIKKNITPITYFELFQEYPIIKTSSKRDVFLKKSFSDDIEVISNETLKEYLNTKSITRYFWDFEWSDSKVSYENIIKNISFADKKQIEPFYFKKPNIS